MCTMLLATGTTAEDPRIALDLLQPKRACRKRKQPSNIDNNDGNAEEPEAAEAAAAELDPDPGHRQEGMEVEEGEAAEVPQGPDEPASAAAAADADTDSDREALHVQPRVPAPDNLEPGELLQLLHSNRTSMALWQSLAWSCLRHFKFVARNCSARRFRIIGVRADWSRLPSQRH